MSGRVVSDKIFIKKDGVRARRKERGKEVILWQSIYR